VVPLVQFTADRTKMGQLMTPRWLILFAALIAVAIIALNIKLLFDQVGG
jgi:manganese transport protein